MRHVSCYTGSDAADGLTPATAKATITSALASADHGDIVKIASGTYTAVPEYTGVRLTLEGGYTADFTVRDHRVYVSTINGRLDIRSSFTLDGLAITTGTTCVALQLNGAVDPVVTVQNCTISGSSEDGILALTVSGMSMTVVIASNTIRDCAQGINLGSQGTRNVFIYRNTLQNIASEGIEFQGSGLQGLLIASNTITGCTLKGISGGCFDSPTAPDRPKIVGNTITGCGDGISWWSGPADIRNNLVVRNTSDGMNLEGISVSYNLRVVNNTIADNQGAGIWKGPGAHCYNNIIANNNSGGYNEQDFGVSTHGEMAYNVFANNSGGPEDFFLSGAQGEPPLSFFKPFAHDNIFVADTMTVFVDALNGDYRLAADSLAIDAGNPADPAGDEPAPNGGRIDCGAYGGTPWATASEAVAPGAITDLAASTAALRGEVTLSWSAPGDDGYSGRNIYGARYLVRYATYSINGYTAADWWNSAAAFIPQEEWIVGEDTTKTDPVNAEFASGQPVGVIGVHEQRVVYGLEPGVTYYFMIKTRDNSGNTSPPDSRSSDPGTMASFAANDTGDSAPRLGHTQENVLGPASQRRDGSNIVELKFRVQDADGPSDTSTLLSGSAQYRINASGWQAASGLSFSAAPFVPAADFGGTEYTLLWYTTNTITSLENNFVEFRFKATDGDAESLYASTGPFAVDNRTPSVSGPAIVKRTPAAVQLQWSGYVEPNFDQYHVRYATYPFASSSPESADRVWTAANDPALYLYSATSTIVAGLSVNTSYWFYVQARDTFGHAAKEGAPVISTCTLTDAGPPGAISDLTALTGTFGGEIRLQWTAPGNEGASGDITGGLYEIKYSSAGIITAANYAGPPQPAYTRTISTDTVAGQEQVFTVTGLVEGATYWFAIRMRDPAEYWGAWNSSADAGVNTAAFAAARSLQAPGTFTGDFSQDGGNVYDGGGTDDAYGIAIDTFSPGGPYLYAVGATLAGGLNDFLIVKYDVLGNKLLSRLFNGARNGHDHAYRAAVDASGNVYVTGSARQNNLSDDFFTIRYSSGLDVLASAPFDLPASGDRANAVAVDASGNVIVAGDTFSGTYNALLIKYDPSLSTVLSSAAFDSGGHDYTYDVCIDTQSNVIVAGSYNNYFTVMKYDPSLSTVLSSATFGSGNTAYAVRVDSAGNVLAGGTVWTGSSYDYCVVKYPPSLSTVLSSASYNAGATDQAYSLAIDGSGNVVLSGMSSNDYFTVAFDPSLSSVIHFARYDSGGSDTARGVAAGPDGYVYIAGSSNDDFRVIRSRMVDDAPPAAIADLTAMTGTAAGTVSLTWTAPGTNGAAGSIAGGFYEIKYSSAGIITAANYASPPAPSYTLAIATSTTPGQAEKSVITGLAAGAYYWFAVKTRDAAGNWSVWNSSADAAGVNTLAYAQAKPYGSTPPLGTFSGSFSQDGGALYDGTGPDDAFGVAVDTFSPGGPYVYVVGVSSISGGFAPDDMFIVKYDASGARLVSNYFSREAGYNDSARAVRVDAGGSVVVAGYTRSFTSHDDITVLRYDRNLELLASATAAARPGMFSDQAYAVAFDTAGNVVVAGKAYNGANDDCFVVKFTPSLSAVISSATFNSGGADYACGLAVDTESRVIVTGVCNGFMATLKYSPDLSVLVSSRTFAGNSYAAQAAAFDPGGNVFVAGRIWNANEDWIIVKYDGALGAVLSSTTINGSANGSDCAYALAVDSMGYVIVAGKMGNASGNTDFTVRKFNADLSPTALSITYDGGADDAAKGIALESTEYAYITGNSNNDIRTIRRSLALPESGPPGAVTDLSGEPGPEGIVRLAWSVPGDDGYSGTLSAGSAYAIQYSTSPDGTPPGAWDRARAQVSVSTSGVAAGTPVTQAVSGLSPGATYYFRIWHADEVPNWSALSNGATAYAGPWVTPGKVTGLAAYQTGSPHLLKLAWTTPGDNGYSGALPAGSAFLIQHSTSFAGVVWSTANAQVMISTEVAQGAKVATTVSLPLNEYYYFSVWTKDADGNYSVSASTTGAFGSPFSYELVDGAGGTSCGTHTSMAFDKDGNAHIGYKYVNGELHYIKRTGGVWGATQKIDGSGGGPDVGFYGSLALDGAGGIHVAYQDLTNRDLKYAKYEGAWSTATLDAPNSIGEGASMAVDGAGRLHVSYCDWTNGDLKYAKFDGVAWSTAAVDTPGTVGLQTSIAVDGAGNPHIAYKDNATPGLKYARWNGTGWTKTMIEAGAGFVDNPALVIDGHGHGHVAYKNAAVKDLRYARFDGVAWSTATVDDAGDQGEYISLALDGGGRPHIAYYDNSSGYYNLKYAYNDGVRWSTSTVDSEGSVGAFTSIAIDGNGDVHISYTYMGPLSDYDLRVARWSGAGFTPPMGGNARGKLQAPSGMHAAVVYASSITWRWTDNASNELGFRIYGSTRPAPPYELLADTMTIAASGGTGGTVEWTHGGLAPNTSWQCYAAAVNAGGVAASSSPWTWTRAQGPSSVSFVSVSSWSVRIQWPDSGNPSSTRWGIFRSTDNFAGSSTTLADLSSAYTSTAYTDAGLDAEAAYYYSVCAYNQEGLASFGVAVSTVTVWPEDTAAPQALTDLGALPGTLTGEVRLSWSAPGDDGVTGALKSGALFTVQYSTAPDWDPPGAWSQGAAQVSVSTSGVAAGTLVGCTITGLTGGATYYFRVWHSDRSSNWSGLSNGATSWAMLVPEPPLGPTGFSGIVLSSASIEWQWTDNEDYESGYRVKSDTGGIIASLGANTTSWTETGLPANTSWYRYAEAYNAAGSSGCAGIVRFTFASRPVNTAFTGVHVSSIAFGWERNGNSGQTRWEVFRSTDGFTTSTTTLKDYAASFTLTEYADTGLLSGVTYFYKVRAVNGAAVPSDFDTEISTYLADIVPPSAVTDLGAAPGTQEGEILLSWTAPGDDGTAGMLPAGAEFKIQHSTHAGVAWSPASAQVTLSAQGVLPSGTTACVLNGLTPGTTYFIRLWTSDETLNWSAPSNGATAQARIDPPLAPSGFAAIVLSSASIKWLWTDDEDNEAGYRIKSDTGGIMALLGANTTSWTETGLQANTSWYRHAEAYNAAGSSACAGLARYTLANRPVNTAFTGIHVSSIAFSWERNGNPGQTRWEVFRSTDGFAASTTTLKDYAAGYISVSYVDTDLLSGVTYFYRVRAANDEGVLTDFDTAVSTYLADTASPAAVTDLRASPGAQEGTIVLAWTVPGDNGTEGALPAGAQFILQRSTYSGVAWSTASVQVSLPAQGLLPHGTTACVLNGLTPGATYFVRLWTGDGNANWSPVSNGATAQARIELPAAPPVFSGTALSTSSVRWTWNAAAGGETGFVVRAATGGMIAVLAAGDTGYVEEGLAVNTAYSRFLTVVNAGGESGPSGTAATYTLAAPPDLLSVSTFSAHNLTLAWEGRGATAFRIELSTDAAAWQTAADRVTATTHTLGNLRTGTTYYIAARSYNGDYRLSAGSATLCATTAAVPNVIIATGTATRTIEVTRTTGGVALQVRVEITQGAFDREVYIDVNVDPLHDPRETDITRINQANASFNTGTRRCLGETVTEFNLYALTGERYTGAFAEDVAITLSYPDGDNDGKVDGTEPPLDERTMQMYVLDEARGIWRPAGGTVNTAANRVEARVRHFSVYALAGERAAAGNLSQVRVYPNPYRPGSGTAYDRAGGIVFAGLTPRAVIRVYTLAGELVFEGREENGDGLFEWQADNISGEKAASGVYIYLVTDPDDPSDIARGKTAIIK